MSVCIDVVVAQKVLQGTALRQTTDFVCFRHLPKWYRNGRVEILSDTNKSKILLRVVYSLFTYIIRDTKNDL